jgi:uncharacterized protein (TIGR02444 family)
LQDRYNCDVNLLLFAAWVGAVRNRTLTSGEMNGAALAVRDWHAEIVRPLRDVRRRLKSGPFSAPDASDSLRARIKSVEIEAERLELAALQKLATNCYDSELTVRAADVCLKERRPVVLLFRETPLHAGRIEIMAQARRNGAIVMPPVPAFYTKPKSLGDAVEQTVGRALDLFEIDTKL